MINKHFSRELSVFHGQTAPETGFIAGYGAIIDALKLPVPLPRNLSLISRKNRRYVKDEWQVLTSRHKPEDSLYKQLVFALKYEGINLLLLKKLFQSLDEREICKLLQIEPLGRYSRRLWFLYEWLFDRQLDISDLKSGNFVPLLDEKLQYAIDGKRSSRHRIINNLPGTRNFCPLIHVTPKLEEFIEAHLSDQKKSYLDNIHKYVLQRAAAFLLLKDSRASFTIEGENPMNRRAVRWGKAIGQAGMKPLSKEEMIRLQQIIIESQRFTKMGFRKQDGFVGEHDRTTGEPIPEHISARWQDLEQLIDGLVATNMVLEKSEMDAVLAATMLAFGFVFIHPFVDGNGRIHRYLIHHILARKGFSQKGTIFPVSASILNKIDEYRQVLESCSHPLLDFIQWKSTPDNNVEVLNETIDYYRYFDATRLAEFLYGCVEETIEHIIPDEIRYLQKFDEMKMHLDDRYEMPDQLIALLIRILEQNKGKLSKRFRSMEFKELSNKEVKDIETLYKEIFLNV